MSKTGDSVRTKASRKERMEKEQIVMETVFEITESTQFKHFNEMIAVLFGPTGIGKTTFAYELGRALPKNGNTGTYHLTTEPTNNPAAFRQTRIQNWPTFKSFITQMEKSPSKVKTVSMWVIDTIDSLIPMCMSSVCWEWGLTDLSEEGFARAWGELREELVYNLLRLHALGPGILMISHERQVETLSRKLQLTKESLNLSPGVCDAIKFLSSVIFHMRYVDRSKNERELGHMRCLSIRGSDEEIAKDNTGKLQAVADEEGIIKFRTEKQAVSMILGCFEDGGTVIKKTKKKVKKVKRSH